MFYRFLCLIAVMLVTTCAAFAQTGAPTGTVPLGTGSVGFNYVAPGALDYTATGGTTARTLQDRAADVFDVMDYGAKCDGTDDTAAINATIAAGRALITVGISKAVRIRFPSTRWCTINSSIDFTGFNQFGVSVDGAHIICEVNGAACVDAYGSFGIAWEGINIRNALGSANRPTVGIQIGKIGAGIVSMHYFNHAEIFGKFSLAAFYNFGSETTTFIAPKFYNSWTGDATGKYALIQDGCNHFGVTSTFVTQTLAADTCQSFIGDNFFGGTFEVQGDDAIPIFISNALQHQFLGIYACGGCSGVGTPSYAVVIHTINNGSATNSQLVFDAHFETTPTDVFLFSADTATATIRGFKYRDNNSQAATSIIKLDTAGTHGTSITGLNIYNLDIDVANSVAVDLPLFADPTLITTSGRVVLKSQAEWTEPKSFSGTVCILEKCTPYVPTLSLNRNPDFWVDQVNEASALTIATTTSATVIDGWIWAAAGGLMSGIVSGQQVDDAPTSALISADYHVAKSFKMTEIGATTDPPNVAHHWSIRSSIVNGENLAGAGWGAAGGVPLQLQFCAKANHTGTYAASLSNSAGNRSYVIDFALTADTWACFKYKVPADTTGTWLNLSNQVGIYMFFTPICGANYQTTPLTWAAGVFHCTSSSYNLWSVSGATLQITHVVANIGEFRLPYQPRTFADEMVRAQTYYVKSFDVGAQVKTNSGSALGAATIYAPYAAATNTKTGVYVKFPIPMSIGIPLITFFSTNAATANCYNATAAADTGAAAGVNISRSGFFLECTITSATLGDQIRVHWTADSRT